MTAAKKVPAKVPSAVTVGSQVYRIVERTPGEDGGLSDSHAYTLNASNMICLSVELPPARKRSFLMHELLHAMIFTFSQSERNDKSENHDEWEHYFIGLVQEPLVMLLRDNPDLLEYLTND
jgi:hypothetical protein